MPEEFQLREGAASTRNRVAKSSFPVSALRTIPRLGFRQPIAQGSAAAR